MTPQERCARLATAYSPEDWPLDPAPRAESPPHDFGRLERRLAVAFAFVAVAIFGFVIGKTL